MAASGNWNYVTYVLLFDEKLTSAGKKSFPVKAIED